MAFIVTGPGTSLPHERISTKCHCVILIPKHSFMRDALSANFVHLWRGKPYSKTACWGGNGTKCAYFNLFSLLGMEIGLPWCVLWGFEQGGRGSGMCPIIHLQPFSVWCPQLISPHVIFVQSFPSQPTPKSFSVSPSLNFCVLLLTRFPFYQDLWQVRLCPPEHLQSWQIPCR